MAEKIKFSDLVDRIEKAKYASEIRDCIVSCLKMLDESINVSVPTNCPNCGANVTGRTANCEYCGTLLIWKAEGNNSEN